MFAYNPKPKALISNKTSVDPICESLPKVNSLSLSQAKQVHTRIVLFGLTSHGKPISHLLSSLSLSPPNPREGLQIHCHVVKLGFGSDVFVTNALLGFYSRCVGSDLSWRVFHECDVGSGDLVTYNTMLAGLVRDGQVKDAENLFDEMPERDLISWSTMIMGYVQNGSPEEALGRFREVVETDLWPNEATERRRQSKTL